jgi:hypothetical protein
MHLKKFFQKNEFQHYTGGPLFKVFIDGSRFSWIPFFKVIPLHKDTGIAFVAILGTWWI